MTVAAAPPETVERIAGALERLRELGELPGHADTRRLRAVRVLRGSYVPWWGQRQFHRAERVELAAPRRTARLVAKHFTCRVLVAGRQSGKTEAAVAELISVMLEKPGSYSVLLAPTYKIAQAAIRKVLARAAEIPGWKWLEQKKELHLPNGSIWAVFSADRKESVRGPHINGLFWVDEGAFLSVVAWEAALGALSAVADARIVITTTPMGKNWVHGEFTDPDNARFRFRTEDSPYCNRALVAKLRKKMSAEKAAQEFDAVFVDNLLLVFPTRPWVQSFPEHKGAPENVLGVDLAKRVDWTVITLMNQWGEATILARVQKLPYPEITKLIAELAKLHSATPVIDRGGAGGGPGEVVNDYLVRDYGLEPLLVNTGSPGMKAKIVEQCQGDVQWGRISLLQNEHYEQADHELGRFQGMKRIVHGEEVMRYEGPQMEGEHDDCVISLCLANWGRLHVEREDDTGDGGLASFRPQSHAGGTPRADGRSGYIFQQIQQPARRAA